jgi:ribosomal protein L37AE/L43A
MRLWVSARVPFTPLRVGTSFGGRRRYRSTASSGEGNAALGYVVLIVAFVLLVAAAVHSWLWAWLLVGVTVFIGYHLAKAYRHPDTVKNTVEDREAKVKSCPPCREAITRARRSGEWERCRRCRTPWRIRKPAATPNQAAVSDRR